MSVTIHKSNCFLCQGTKFCGCKQNCGDPCVWCCDNATWAKLTNAETNPLKHVAEYKDGYFIPEE